eukprot:795791-Pleurochrysis_carterae.AAC.5
MHTSIYAQASHALACVLVDKRLHTHHPYEHKQTNAHTHAYIFAPETARAGLVTHVRAGLVMHAQTVSPLTPYAYWLLVLSRQTRPPLLRLNKISSPTSCV